MAITAKDVNELRQKTGLGMMECKQALTETGGDIQKAVDLLRSRGLAKMDTRTDRASAEGQILIGYNADKSKVAIVEFNTETDFTARNDGFLAAGAKLVEEALKQAPGQVQKTDAMQVAIDEVRLTTKENAQFGRGHVLGGAGKVGSYKHFTGKVGVLIEVSGNVSDELLTDLCMHIAAITPSPIAIDETGVPAEIIEKEKAIAKAQAIEQGKPEQIAEKMVIGKIRKFYEENCLLDQLFIKDDKKRVKELLPAGAKVLSFVRYALGGR
jgi:elongation factor Ts